MIQLVELDTKNSRVIINEHCYMINYLKKIIDLYEDEVQRIKVFTYLFYITCLDKTRNPYIDLPEDAKEETILKDLDIDFSLDEVEIIEARKRLDEVFTTPTRRFYLDLKIGIEKLGKYLRETTIDHGRDGNLAPYTNALKSYRAISKEFKLIEKEYNDELSETRLRGGAETAYDEN